MNFLEGVLLAFLLSLGTGRAAPNSPREKTPQNDELLKNHEGFMAWFGLVGDNFSPLQGQKADYKKQDGIAPGPVQEPAKDSASTHGEVSQPPPPPRRQQKPSVNLDPSGHSDHRKRERAETTESKVNAGERKPSSTNTKSHSSPKTGPRPNSYLRPPPLSRPNPQEIERLGVQGQKERASLAGYSGKSNLNHPKQGRTNQGQARPGRLNPTRQTTPERRPNGGRRIPDRPGTGQMITDRPVFSHQSRNQLNLDQQHPGRMSVGQQNLKLPHAPRPYRDRTRPARTRPGPTRPGLPYSGGTHPGQPYPGRWNNAPPRFLHGRGPSVNPPTPVINQPFADGPVAEAPEQGKPSQSKSTFRGSASRPRQTRPRQPGPQMYVPAGHAWYRPFHQHNSYWKRPRHPSLQNWMARRPSNATASEVCSAEGKRGICVTGDHDCRGAVFSKDKKFLCESSSYKCCPYVSRVEIVQYRKLPFAVTYPGFKCGGPSGEIGRCQEMILECGPGKEASGRCRSLTKAKCCTKSAKVPSP